ncbi:MAG: DNA recombination protein RmuC [Armatimonadetes bacterium]|nr:DNA recombination protein RmuC [Armatimonadota bacterium]
MEAIWVLVGLVVGTGIAWWLSRGRSEALQSRIQDSVDRLAAQESAQRELTEKLEAANRELQSSTAECEGLRNALTERDKAHDERMAAYKDAEDQLKDTFKALSGDVLKASTEELAKNAEEILKRYKEVADADEDARKKDIESLLQPMKDRLRSLDEQNQQMERHRSGAYKELMEQVRAMRDQQVGLTRETTRLVKALQDPGTAGNWGEVALERVVEKAGLEEHVSYVLQETFEADGSRQRPDMIIHLPGDRCLIIDSKAPMRSYIEALECEDEDSKQNLLAQHALKLLGHAKDLRKRDYPRLTGSAPDYVVLFIGSEAAYHAAHTARKTLNEEVWDCNVVLASPNSLLGLLRAVNYGWQQEKLAQSARQLQADAATLYERVCKIAGDYVRLGRSLESAGKAFNEMGATLESRVLPAARKFKDHGVQTNSELAVVEPIEFAPRPLQAAEFGVLPGFELDPSA